MSKFFQTFSLACILASTACGHEAEVSAASGDAEALTLRLPRPVRLDFVTTASVSPAATPGILYNLETSTLSSAQISNGAPLTSISTSVINTKPTSPTSPADDRAVFTITNPATGDQIFGSYATQVTFSATRVSFTGAWLFTGGTGAYASAIGTGTITGSAPLDGSPFPCTWNGLASF